MNQPHRCYLEYLREYEVLLLYLIGRVVIEPSLEGKLGGLDQGECLKW